MTHLFIIMRPQEPRYLQGFTGDGPSWNTGACWVDHMAFAMPVNDYLLSKVLDGIEGEADITIHPTSMAWQNDALDDWKQQFKQL